MWARVRGITCCMPRVLFAERAERVHGLIRQPAQVRCASDVAGDLAARRPDKQRTLSRVGNPSKASADCDAQGDDKASIIGQREGTCESETAVLAMQRRLVEPCSEYTIPRPGCSEHPRPGIGALVSGKGLAIVRPASWGRNSSSWGPWNELEGMLG